MNGKLQPWQIKPISTQSNNPCNRLLKHVLCFLAALLDQCRHAMILMCADFNQISSFLAAWKRRRSQLALS
jgi:hypothetical protein